MDHEKGKVVDFTTATSNSTTNTDSSEGFNGMKIAIVVIACVGVITNLIVVIVFLNDRKLRRKIPNICIINQVCSISYAHN